MFGQIDLTRADAEQPSDFADRPALHDIQLEHLKLRRAHFLLHSLLSRLCQIPFPFLLPNRINVETCRVRHPLDGCRSRVGVGETCCRRPAGRIRTLVEVTAADGEAGSLSYFSRQPFLQLIENTPAREL